MYPDVCARLSQMASYSLYSALFLTMVYMTLVKSSVLYREWGAFWDTTRDSLMRASLD